MNRFISDTSVFIVGAAFSLFCSSAPAQEVYKWTDANGKVHYGDRAAAPESSKQMHIDAEPPRPRPPVSTPAAISGRTAGPSFPTIPPIAATRYTPPPLPERDVRKKSVPANPALVGPACQGFIDKVIAVPDGTSFELQAKQFDIACPGIAYECTRYRSKPQNNQCIWIERSGTSILRTNSYP